MPIRTVPDTDLEYHLICFDKKGRERDDDPDGQDGLLSKIILNRIASQTVTDIFLISHGWKGDVDAAIEQFDDWIGAMATCTEDRLKVRQVRPGFEPLIIGLHWPSLPWGDESLPEDEDPTVDSLIASSTEEIVDTERGLAGLRTIFESALENIAPTHMPPEVAAAYRIVQEETGLAAEGPGGAPGDDAEAFDPEQAYQQALEITTTDASLSFGFSDSIVQGILSPLRQLSFWKMKRRARTFGESGAADLLRNLMDASQTSTRCHLMGHSFGCIVVSAAVAGTGGDALLPRPVHSLYLVQGALSLWAYCTDIPVADGKKGYFRALISKNKVAGPILTTRSRHDTAVGSLYPLAAGIKRHVAFDAPVIFDTEVTPDQQLELPKYGAIGEFGIQGMDENLEELNLLPVEDAYTFQPGKVYNLECAHVIKNGDGASGAHSDISHPEVAHALWAAVMTSV